MKNTPQIDHAHIAELIDGAINAKRKEQRAIYLAKIGGHIFNAGKAADSVGLLILLHGSWRSPKTKKAKRDFFRVLSALMNRAKIGEAFVFEEVAERSRTYTKSQPIRRLIFPPSI